MASLSSEQEHGELCKSCQSIKDLRTLGTPSQLLGDWHPAEFSRPTQLSLEDKAVTPCPMSAFSARMVAKMALTTFQEVVAAETSGHLSFLLFHGMCGTRLTGGAMSLR